MPGEFHSGEKFKDREGRNWVVEAWEKESQNKTVTVLCKYVMEDNIGRLVCILLIYFHRY